MSKVAEWELALIDQCLCLSVHDEHVAQMSAGANLVSGFTSNETGPRSKHKLHNGITYHSGLSDSSICTRPPSHARLLQFCLAHSTRSGASLPENMSQWFHQEPHLHRLSGESIRLFTRIPDSSATGRNGQGIVCWRGSFYVLIAVGCGAM